MKRGLVWFKNNLRLADNEPLWRAIEENDEILPVYIIEDSFWETNDWGNCRTGLPRTKFLAESVLELKSSLQALGGDLLILSGSAAEILEKLFHEYEIAAIYTPTEFAFDEQKQENALARVLPLKTFWESSLIHPDDLPFSLDKLPDVFTAFRHKVEKQCVIRPVFPQPTAIKLIPTDYSAPASFHSWQAYLADARAALTFIGGEGEANERLQHYFWKSKAISTYKETRNGLLGADYSSKFSPWLANGSISPRTIYWELKKYEASHGENESTYWLFFELLWRDFFRFVALKYGARLFHKSGLRGVERSSSFNAKWHEKWKTGQTGEPFVDANMRELLLTGFMSNRGRQNVASYWVHNLKQEWRAGAAWFESQLIDYDPCSNYGNWLYVAGLGNDPRPNRVFNVQRQAEMYDPKGEYVRRWLMDEG